MDGVLVDVSASYREAVRMTARLFFKGAPGWARLPNPLFSLEEIAAVKQSGRSIETNAAPSASDRKVRIRSAIDQLTPVLHEQVESEQ